MVKRCLVSSRSMGALLLVLVFSLGIFSRSGGAADGMPPESCGAPLAEVADPSISHTELTDEAIAFMDSVGEFCPAFPGCSDRQLDAAIKVAIEKTQPRFRQYFDRIHLLSRRGLVLLLWGGSILGPGVISYYLTAGVGEGLRYSVTTFVMTMTGILFGRFSSPVDKKLGPRLEQLAFSLWNPAKGDTWGQIMRRIPETDRLKFSQQYNQLVVLRTYFEIAGSALRRQEHKVAARHFADAILNSYEMFGGLHLDHPATLRSVRGHLPELTSEIRDILVEEAVSIIRDLPDDEVSHDTLEEKDKVLSFARETMRTWLRR